MSSDKGQKQIWKFVRLGKEEESAAPALVPIGISETSSNIPGRSFVQKNISKLKQYGLNALDDFSGGVFNFNLSLGSPQNNQTGPPVGFDSLSKVDLQNLQKNITIVDVINNFPWTFSTQRHEVPRIIMKEKYLKTNALLNQAVYNLLTSKGIVKREIKKINRLVATAAANNPDTVGAAVRGTSSVIDEVRSLITNPNVTDIFNKLSSNEGKAKEQNVKKNVKKNQGGSSISRPSTLDVVKENYVDPNDFKYIPLGQKVLEPYDALYLTHPTGFRYEFPYFADTNKSVTNEFAGDSQTRNWLDSLVFEASEALTSGLTKANIAVPGTYIERTKFYNFPDSGDSYTFSFPLINTVDDYNIVRRNWQLIYMLVYQNRPNRKSRDLVDPAVMYEIKIPGVMYSPYCYISNLDVQFRGSRRQMDITVLGQGNSQTTFPTIIPEAYEVTITVKSLVADSRNFMYALLDGENLVTTAGGEEVNLFTQEDATEITSSFASVGESAQLETGEGEPNG